jgi:FkbM family methyltransferase
MAMMKRPLLLRLLPLRIRASVWSRCYFPTSERYYPLFSNASLQFAPDVRMQLLPGDAISDSIAFTGTYDLRFTRVLHSLARKGGRLVDVGANLGYFSLLWAAASRHNSVVAFEASPRTLEMLRNNVSQNRFEAQIEIRSQAVGKDNTEMQFDPGPEGQTGWGGLALARSALSHSVQVVRLDDALRDVDQIDLLKIDIEGADTWALLGAERLLKERRVKYVWWEQHKPRMRELNIPEGQAAEFLRSLGYRPVPQSDLRADTVNWCANIHN